MVPITQLPDLCMLGIFKRIPLTNMISKLSSVCKKWTELQPVDLGQRKRLVLVCSPDNDFDFIIHSVQKIENHFENDLVDDVKDDDDKPWAPLMPRSDIEFNLIRVPKVNHVYTLTEQFTTSLMDSLRSITHLTVVITLDCSFIDQTNTTLRQLARIIDHYGENLVSLKVDLDDIRSFSRLRDDNQVEIDAQVLFDSINRIKNKLNHVSLNIRFPSKRLSTDSLAFLARVQSFTTHKFRVSRGRDQMLRSSLVQYAAGGTCTQIHIGKWFGLEELINLNPNLIIKFRRLAVVSREGEGEEGADDEESPNIDRSMQLFGRQFASLSSLELTDVHIPITKIARYLTHMTGLVTLKIEYLLNVKLKYESEEGLVINQLPSVRMLTFNVCGQNHSDIEKLHLGELFPNLQVVEYEPGNENIECVECATVWTYGETNLQRRERMKKAGKCARLALLSLPRLIPRLRLVRYLPVTSEEDEEFLPAGEYNLEQLRELADVPEE